MCNAVNFKYVISNLTLLSLYLCKAKHNDLVWCTETKIAQDTVITADRKCVFAVKVWIVVVVVVVYQLCCVSEYSPHTSTNLHSLTSLSINLFCNMYSNKCNNQIIAVVLVERQNSYN